MLFHTWPFAIFLLIVLPVFFALRKTRLWLPWLTAASYFFYGWWNPYYLFLVFYSTVLDFSLVALMDHCPRGGQRVDVRARLTRLRFDDRVLKFAFIGATSAAAGILGLALSGPKTLRPTMGALGVLVLLMALGALLSSRRIWLLISLVNNLALLLFFKYARFVVENLNAVFAGFHVAVRLPDPSTLMPFGFEYLLPVGISFFTFQSLSYTIDFYLGNVQRERNFLRFATFVCFFPQLATGLGDFWSRWHISLSTWFRDYVYIPLGGNKHGTFNMYRNLFLTFFISGIWHGAAWTFFIWGTLHALSVMITRELERSAF